MLSAGISALKFRDRYSTCKPVSPRLRAVEADCAPPRQASCTFKGLCSHGEAPCSYTTEVWPPRIRDPVMPPKKLQKNRVTSTGHNSIRTPTPFPGSGVPAGRAELERGSGLGMIQNDLGESAGCNDPSQSHPAQKAQMESAHCCPKSQMTDTRISLRKCQAQERWHHCG